MTDLCGHKRDALRKALEFANASNIDDVSRGWPRPDGGVGALLFDVHDPAKLAEMLAERGRELGWYAYDCDPGDSLLLPCLVIVSDEDNGKISIEPFRDWEACRGEQESVDLAMPQARTILLQWLQLPNGAHEEALRVLRGEP